jgi:hypothetical protein
LANLTKLISTLTLPDSPGKAPSIENIMLDQINHGQFYFNKGVDLERDV